MNIAFCIGNGSSRSRFDLNILRDAGPTYGCNNLIETFPLDNTIVVDRMLLVDLLAKGVNQRTNIYTRRRWHTAIQADNLHFLTDPILNPTHQYDNEIHWGSGTHALNLAASTGIDIVVMIGYDIWQNDIDANPWIHQIKRCFELYPDVQFVQIQADDWKHPDEWTNENFLIDNFDGLQALLEQNN